MLDPKLDVLAIAAHPDDAELGCGGTLAKMAAMGRKVGILDLTRGELGTRGSIDKRAIEAENASKILGLSVRLNLGLPDGFLTNSAEQKLAVVTVLRRFKPELVLLNAPKDRHPDHGNGSVLASEACFLSGLSKIQTYHEGVSQGAWRPAKVWHYLQDLLLMPSCVVDISGHYDQKIAAIRAFDSQFYNPESEEPMTYISSLDFIHFVEARAREMGHLVGCTFGEGFIQERPLKVDDPMMLL